MAEEREPSRADLLVERLAATDDDVVEVNRAFLLELIAETKPLYDLAARMNEDRRRLIDRSELAEMLADAGTEVGRRASLEGRIEWSEIEGIDGEAVPQDQVAVRAFYRVGNDIGQGGGVLIERGVGEGQ